MLHKFLRMSVHLTHSNNNFLVLIKNCHITLSFLGYPQDFYQLIQGDLCPRAILISCSWQATRLREEHHRTSCFTSSPASPSSSPGTCSSVCSTVAGASHWKWSSCWSVLTECVISFPKDSPGIAAIYPGNRWSNEFNKYWFKQKLP